MDRKMTVREVLSGPMHVRESADGSDSRVIEGYAIVFGKPSVNFYADMDETVREMIAPSAVTRSLLDSSDIKMTMFHDREILLARSNMGKGTLSYRVDEKGVFFSFEAPHTVDGDKALELVRRGDIAGCSFAFSSDYSNPQYVVRTEEPGADGKKVITYNVVKMERIYDFTLASDPAYPQTSVDAREAQSLEDVEAGFRDREKAGSDKEREERERKEKQISEQVRQMRKSASLKL